MEIHQPVAIVPNAFAVLNPVRVYTEAAIRLSTLTARSMTAENETTSRRVLRRIPAGEIFLRRASAIAGDTMDAAPMPITALGWIAGECSVTSTEKTGFRKARGSARQPNRRMAAKYKPEGG